MTIKYIIVATDELKAEDIIALFKENNIFQIYCYTLSAQHVVIGIRKWYRNALSKRIFTQIETSTKEEVVSISLGGHDLDVVDLEKHYNTVDDFLKDMDDIDIDAKVYNELMCLPLKLENNYDHNVDCSASLL
jgi:predicted phosphoadenosine phosphosulfate sulfurtransferase